MKARTVVRVSTVALAVAGAAVAVALFIEGQGIDGSAVAAIAAIPLILRVALALGGKVFTAREGLHSLLAASIFLFLAVTVMPPCVGVHNSDTTGRVLLFRIADEGNVRVNYNALALEWLVIGVPTIAVGLILAAKLRSVKSAPPASSPRAPDAKTPATSGCRPVPDFALEVETGEPTEATLAEPTGREAQGAPGLDALKSWMEQRTPSPESDTGAATAEPAARGQTDLGQKDRKAITPMRRSFEDRCKGAAVAAGGLFVLGFGLPVVIRLASPEIYWVVKILVGLGHGALGLLAGLMLSRKACSRVATFGVLLGGVTLVGGLLGRSAGEAAAQGVVNAQRVFRDETHRVSFRYPADWEPVPPQSKGTLVMLHARDGSFATCNLSVRNADREATEQLDEAYWKSALVKMWPDARIRSIEFIDAFGERRVIIEYDFTLITPSAEVPASSLTLAAIQHGKRYMLILNAKSERIDTVRPIFDLMAGTLMFDRE